MENEMKSFFLEKSQPHVKKSSQSNIPKIVGQSITELNIIDHLKEREEAKQLKVAEKEAKKHKTSQKFSMPPQNPAEKEDVIPSIYVI